MRLMGKKVLVTGGAGMIGSHVIDLLVDEGCERIVAVDNLVRGRRANLADALSRGPVELIEGDISDRSLMNELVRETEVVFHLAALRITHCAEKPELAMQTMANASFDLLQSCVRHQVEKVIASSSASIYGMAEVFPTGESHHSYNNRTLYGAMKSFLESLLRSFNEMYGLSYVALRYFNVYGERMDIHGLYTEVMIRWIERICAGESPIIFGNGDQSMDFVHVRDVARANILAAKADISDQVLNIGSGSETTLQQLLATLLTVMKSSKQPAHQAERSVNPVQRRLADVSLARQLLNFQTEVTLEQGLYDLVEWWRSERLPVRSETYKVQVNDSVGRLTTA